MEIKTKRMLSLGLSLLNSAGVVGTFIFVAKETPKVNAEMDALPKDSKKRTKFKTFVKNYKKSLIFAGATIASGITEGILSYKIESSLIATAAMLDASLRQYKDKVKEKLGLEQHKQIAKEIAKENFKKPDDEPQDGEKLYLEEHIGYFYAKPENVKDAYLKLLQDIEGSNCWQSYDGYCSNGIFTIGEFLTACKGRPLSKNLQQERLDFGWSNDYMYESWNYSWVHMQLEDPDEDGAIFITWMEEPIWNPWGWYDHEYEHITDEEYYQGNKDLLSDPDNKIYTIKERKTHE